MSAIESIPFHPDGPPLAVRVACGEAQIGRFDLRLFEADGRTPVPGCRWQGEFAGPDADNFALPGPAVANTGRIIRCRARIGILPPMTTFDLRLAVEQGDGELLGEIVDTGTARHPTELRILHAQLVAAPEPAARPASVRPPSGTARPTPGIPGGSPTGDRPGRPGTVR